MAECIDLQSYYSLKISNSVIEWYIHAIEYLNFWRTTLWNRNIKIIEILYWANIILQLPERVYSEFIHSMIIISRYI